MQLNEYDKKEIFCGKNKSEIEKQKPNGCIDELEEDASAISLETKPADPLKVYCIDFHGKKLKEIVNISKFSNCKSADFSCNEIKEISLLDRNTEICELKLYSNEISELKSLDKLRKLQTLQLQHNKINKIGDGLKSLKNLKLLRLSSNCLNGLESNELNSCCNLTYLDLSYNNIKNVNFLKVLPCLEELYLAWNQLESFPVSCSSKKLQEVDLSHNMITNVAGLKTLPKLTVVNVSHNRLQDLVSLSTTRSLQQLDASKNSITDLVHISQQFPNLEILNLTQNCINRWKNVAHLKSLKDLKELYLDGNPVKNELESMWSRRISDILPQLELLDGASLTRPQSRSGESRPMRPMTASQGVSTKMIQDQINVMQHELTFYQDLINSKFAVVHDTLRRLPTKASSPERNTAESRGEESRLTDDADKMISRPCTAEADARPTSRCGSRARLQDALAFSTQYSEASQKQRTKKLNMTANDKDIS